MKSQEPKLFASNLKISAKGGNKEEQMKLFLGFLLTIFISISISAQTNATVSGRLAAAKAVEIRLVTEGGAEMQTAKTDALGNYKFENVTDGNYSLVYTNQQGQEETAAITVKNGQVVYIKEEVYVIASGTEQNFDEVSKSVNVITGQEMRDRADFSLVESLKSIPGFRVQQLGGFGRTASIKTRGLRNQDTAILIDGVRFRDPTAITGDASPFLSDLTLTNVDRIEVLRGSGSSVYGTNAIGGVVDFRTPAMRQGFHGQLSGVAGGYGLKRVRGNVSDGNDKIGYNLGVSRTLYTKGIDGQDDAHNTNFQTRVDYNPFSKTNLSGRIFVGDSYVRLNSNPDTIGTLPPNNRTIVEAVPLSIDELNRYANGTPISQLNRGNATFIPETNDPDNFQKGKFFSGQVALTQVLADNLISQTTYQFLRTDRKNINGPRGVGFQPFGGSTTGLFVGKINTLNSHLDWNLNKNNLVTIGYEYEAEDFLNRGLAVTAAGNFETTAKQTSNTVYAQNQVNLLDRKLQLSAAFRAQFFDLKTPNFSAVNPPYQNLTLRDIPTAYTGDGSIAYFVEQTGTKFRGHIGNGYRVPSLYERFGSSFSSFNQAFVPLGDPNLTPERSLGIDGGIDQMFFNKRAKLSATYFYTRLQNIISFENVVSNIGGVPRSFGGYKNVKGGISRGGEFSGEVKATSSTNIFASYTYTNSDQRVPQVSGSGIFRTLVVPDHQFTLVATQRIYDRLTLNFDFLATSDYLAPIFSNTTFVSYLYNFKGAKKGDVTVNYEIPAYGEKLRFKIFGTIENVFDNEYYENGFRTFGINGRGGFGVSF